jgi:hypothetical protein
MKNWGRFAILLLCVSPVFAGMVTNGTFDSGCIGWALSQTDGFTCSATEGNPGFALILNNAPGPVPQASQTISGLQVGAVYQITLDGKSHYNCCNSATAPGSGVAIDGNQFDFLIVNSQPWTTYSFQFTYTGVSDVLVISSQRNGTDADGEFDNVDINQVGTAAPEPGSLLSLGGGLAALLGLRRKI